MSISAVAALHESAYGTKRTFRDVRLMSAIGGKGTQAGRLAMSAYDPKRTFGPEDCCHAK